jgi:hypothetical protein
MTMKGNEAVKANFKYNSDMFKDDEKKIRCMFCHNRQVSCRFLTWVPVKYKQEYRSLGREFRAKLFNIEPPSP